MYISKRIIITISVFAIGTLGLAGALAIPSTIRIQRLRNAIVTEQAKIDRRYALRNYIRDSIADIEDTRVRLEVLHTIALHEGDELDFVQAIETAAQATGVDMTLNLQTANQTDLSAWERRIPIGITAVGQFPEITSFLNEVEHLPYYIIFDTFTMNAVTSGRNVRINDAPGPEAGDVTALFSGTVYWQSEDTPETLRIDTLIPENDPLR